MGIEEERRIEQQKRLEEQKKRIEKQREVEIARGLQAFERAGISKSEIKKRAHELSWRGKWDLRKVKMDTLARKYESKARK